MSGTVKIRIKTLIVVFIVVVAVAILSIKESVNSLFATIMVIWIAMFSFSVVNIRKSPLLFCFLISFFVFLLARQFIYHYLHIEQAYEFLNKVNDDTYVCILVSLLGISIGIFVSKRISIRTRNKRLSFIGYERTDLCNQKACKIVFYICYIGTMLGVVLQIVYVRRVGYLESYTADSGGAGVPTIISYLSLFTPVAFCLYLGTKPKKKKTIVPIILYEIYAILTLATGQRYPFIGINMLILIYYFLRSKFEKGWIKRYHIILLVLAVPTLMLLLTAYTAIRVGKAFSFDGFWGTLKDFFVEQGGSVNVIRRTINNADQLADMHLVSLHSIYSAVFENGIGRRLFNITTYSGNSIETAFHTNNLAHRLSYIAYGNGYLSGKGTGSSYIAELLHDFGVSGVFIGNIIYGILLCKIDRINFSNTFTDGIKLAMIYYLLFAPRGNFDSFIGNVFTLQSLLGFIAIVFIRSIIRGLRRNRAIIISERADSNMEVFKEKKLSTMVKSNLSIT